MKKWIQRFKAGLLKRRGAEQSRRTDLVDLEFKPHFAPF